MDLTLLVLAVLAGSLVLPSNGFHVDTGINQAQLHQPQIQRARVETTSSAAGLLEAPSSSSSPSSLLLLALGGNAPEIQVQTQMGQIRDAMVLKTMTGTEWRIIEDRGSAMKVPGGPSCTGGTVVFRGFVEEPNKGIFKYVSTCGEESSGRWITKPSEIRRGTVELSARWKVKLPAGQFIYKGFIQTGNTVGKNGAFSAEMTGIILTGSEVGNEKLVGKFRADLVKQFDPTNDKIAGAGGITNEPISMTAKIN